MMQLRQLKRHRHALSDPPKKFHMTEKLPAVHFIVPQGVFYSEFYFFFLYIICATSTSAEVSL